MSRPVRSTCAAIATGRVEGFAAVVDGIFDADRARAARAADAAEKTSRAEPALLAPHRAVLLRALFAVVRPEIRWHLLQMVPRLPLTTRERRQAFERAAACLDDDSRIVAAEALSASFALSADDPALRTRATRAAVASLASPSPAVRARARKLLGQEGRVPDRAAAGPARTSRTRRSVGC